MTRREVFTAGRYTIDLYPLPPFRLAPVIRGRNCSVSRPTYRQIRPRRERKTRGLRTLIFRRPRQTSGPIDRARTPRFAGNRCNEFIYYSREARAQIDLESASRNTVLSPAIDRSLVPLLLRHRLDQPCVTKKKREKKKSVITRDARARDIARAGKSKNSRQQ